MGLADKLRRGFNRWTGRVDRGFEEWARVYQRECKAVCGIQGSEEDRSKPGEAPRRQTGQGQASISCTYDRASRIVKLSANRYMTYHDATLRPWKTIARERAWPILESIRARLR